MNDLLMIMRMLIHIVDHSFTCRSLVMAWICNDNEDAIDIWTCKLLGLE